MYVYNTIYMKLLFNYKKFNFEVIIKYIYMELQHPAIIDLFAHSVLPCDADKVILIVYFIIESHKYTTM